MQGAVLHDGRLLGPWWTEVDPAEGRTTLGIRHVGHRAEPARTGLADEGGRLLPFLDVDAAGDHDVRFGAIA